MNIVHKCLQAMLKLRLFSLADFVIGQVTSWSAEAYNKNYDALHETDEALINRHGWHRCPGCTWAVKPTKKHLACEELVQ